jgi:hypothetical protein
MKPVQPKFAGGRKGAARKAQLPPNKSPRQSLARAVNFFR